MPLLNDILIWSSSLPEWQRDALRRLFQKSTLDANDIDQLYGILKRSHGINVAGIPVTIPLDSSHLPTTSAGTTPVVVVAMRQLTDVNRIDPAQRLPFSNTGMTIIYGGNGTGKSGYARVLKRACRARDVDEKVLPDATNIAAQSNVPSAIFEISQGGTTANITWTSNAPAPDPLSSMAVFDTRCARAYLDSEQDVAYLPYGLDTVESLGRLILPAVEKLLLDEMQKIDTDASSFNDLTGQTAVGKAISGLNPDTDPSTLNKLASLSAAELTRIAKLKKMLAEADSAAAARALRRTTTRIGELRTRIDTALVHIADSRVTLLQKLETETQTALAAEKLVIQQFQAAEALLTGTGDTAWKAMFDAAENYSLKVAYPGSAFPAISDNAKCVLCQRELNEESQNRLQRFKQFTLDGANQTAKNKARELRISLDEFKQAKLDFGLDKTLSEELSQLDSTLAACVTAFQVAADSRRNNIISSVMKHESISAAHLGEDPRPRLNAIEAKLTQQAGELDKAADISQKKTLEAEYAELHAREKLSSRFVPLLNLLSRMKARKALEGCRQDLRTRNITDKARELTNIAVTEALRGALQQEFGDLGVGYIKTKLNVRGEVGRTKHKLVLDFPNSARVDQILSEGEQRAIALGSFFAELRMANHTGGIVFDDPVSSLDHVFRRRVARRMVEEAKNRQVIVFTHDAAFLGELTATLSEKSVSHEVCHLERQISGHTGRVVPSLPWEYMKYKQRIAVLKQKHGALAATMTATPTQENIVDMRSAYDALRATVERIVEDVLLCGIVQRHDDYIRVGNLDMVILIKDAECQHVEKLYKKCHGVVSGHDPVSGNTVSIPDPAELLQDIIGIEGIITAVIARRSAAAAAKNSGANQTP